MRPYHAIGAPFGSLEIFLRIRGAIERQQPSNNDAAIEEKDPVLFCSACRRPLEREDLAFRIPSSMDEKITGPDGGVQILLLRGGFVQIDQRAYSVACDLRGDAVIAAEVDTVIACDPAVFLLNAGVEEPAPGAVKK